MLKTPANIHSTDQRHRPPGFGVDLIEGDKRLVQSSALCQGRGIVEQRQGKGRVLFEEMFALLDAIGVTARDQQYLGAITPQQRRGRIDGEGRVDVANGLLELPQMQYDL